MNELVIDLKLQIRELVRKINTNTEVLQVKGYKGLIVSKNEKIPNHKVLYTLSDSFQIYYLLLPNE